MTSSPKTLSERCAGIAAGAGRAIDWIGDTRRTSQRLDRDADGLVERLRRARNLCRRLGAAARRPMSVGFFGLSQAGKSYLISALASGRNGRLETVMDGERLDFIDHVNPPGGGKEATGLVTRFSRNHQETPPGFPVVLTLLSEADLVKVLGNSFFCDFDRERVAFDTDPAAIRAELKALEARRVPTPVAGLSEDDAIDLQDYFMKRFPKSMEPLLGDYWPTVTTLAPFLMPADRARLLSVLWGRIGEFTETYLRLRGGLEAVGHAPRVCAPMDAIVRHEAGGLTQADNIMNVDILFRMGRDDDDRLKVIPLGPDGPRSEAALPRSLLAALSMEMLFELTEAPQVEGLETIDLLDFPGYRGRLKVMDLAEARQQVEGRDPVAELVLRGKVAYLFERYTDDQEMNVLVLCTPSDKQSDINEVGDALTWWISATQGETASERARRKPGLIWSVTMLDKRIAESASKSFDVIRESWDGFMRMVLLERFEKFDWVRNWADSQPFDNLFLVRKPGMSDAFIDTSPRPHLREKAILDTKKATLDHMRATFVENPLVRRHVADPGGAWDAMLGLNDGGMTRLADYLRMVARVETKLERIEEQVRHVEHDLVGTQLGVYYRADGADEVERKRRLAETVVGALTEQATSFGELLRLMQPSPDQLRSIYVRAEDGGEGDAPSPAPRRGLVVLGGPSSGAPAKPAAARAVRFGKAAIAAWTRQLRSLPERTEIHRVLGLPGEILQALVDEVITGAARHQVEERLVAALEGAEIQASTTRNRLADQQVRIAGMVIAAYVDWLGFGTRPVSERPRIGGTVPVFAPGRPLTGLPVLDDDSAGFTASFILGWFEAFKDTAVNNAGHAAGSEISPEQNERLGRILDLISGRTDAGAEFTGA